MYYYIYLQTNENFIEPYSETMFFKKVLTETSIDTEEDDEGEKKYFNLDKNIKITRLNFDILQSILTKSQDEFQSLSELNIDLFNFLKQTEKKNIILTIEKKYVNFVKELIEKDNIKHPIYFNTEPLTPISFCVYYFNILTS